MYCEQCGTVLDQPSSAGAVPEILYQSETVAPFPLPALQTLAQEGPAVAVQAAEPDRCLNCKRQAPGTQYPFCVAARQRLSFRVVHVEKAFLCDRCARAQVRFAPLVVLFLWIPVLLGVAGLLCYFLGPALLNYSRGFGQTRHLGLFMGLLLSLVALLGVIGILVRLAWRQLEAVQDGDYRRPPYSSTVARLAIHLRKKELLRTLKLRKENAWFLTQEDRSLQALRSRRR
jgi:hypothetical protein